MTDPRGVVKVTAGGQEYTLWLGMSVLADLQAAHGNDVLQQLDPPADAGPGWVPPLGIIVDFVRGSLKRYHADNLAANPFLPDDILAENSGVFEKLIGAAFPDQKAQASGNGKRPKRAA